MKMKVIFSAAATAMLVTSGGRVRTDLSNNAKLFKENGFDIIGTQAKGLTLTCYTLKKSANRENVPTHQGCIGFTGIVKLEPLDYPKQ